MGPHREEKKEILLLEEVDVSIETDYACASCAEDLCYTDEVYLLQICTSRRDGGQLEVSAVLDEEGDYLYDIYYLHLGCWEDLMVELEEEIGDKPSRLDPLRIMHCRWCESDIRETERFGTVTLGEFRTSKRKTGIKFEPGEQPRVICLPCLAIVNEKTLEMWDGLTQSGECTDCLHARCWREGACSCLCHNQD